MNVDAGDRQAGPDTEKHVHSPGIEPPLTTNPHHISPGRRPPNAATRPDAPHDTQQPETDKVEQRENTETKDGIAKSPTVSHPLTDQLRLQHESDWSGLSYGHPDRLTAAAGESGSRLRVLHIRYQASRDLVDPRYG
ncbi:hypothetical protein GCM10009828_052780 [Actinoplanes couchii]